MTKTPLPPSAAIPSDAGTVRYEIVDDQFLRWGEDRDNFYWERAGRIIKEGSGGSGYVVPSFPGRAALQPDKNRHHQLFLMSCPENWSERHWVFSSPPKAERTYEFVYHYTKIETLKFIADSGQLRLGPLQNMNDPREYKPWTFDSSMVATPAGESTPTDVEVAQAKQEAQAIRANSTLACFVSEPVLDRGPMDPWEIRPRGFLMPRMWSQYGDSHSGVCLIFNRAVLLERFDSFIATLAASGSSVISGFNGNVKYTNRFEDNLLADGLMLGMGETVQQQLVRTHDQHFLTKHPDWSGEGEFRLVVMTAQSTPQYLFMDVTDAVVGLVVGENVDITNPSISRFAARFNITANVARAKWTAWTSSVELIDPHIEPQRDPRAVTGCCPRWSKLRLLMGASTDQP
jgi:Protein of unknown function (DUF2971)